MCYCGHCYPIIQQQQNQQLATVPPTLILSRYTEINLNQHHQQQHQQQQEAVYFNNGKEIMVRLTPEIPIIMPLFHGTIPIAMQMPTNNYQLNTNNMLATCNPQVPVAATTATLKHKLFVNQNTNNLFMPATTTTAIIPSSTNTNVTNTTKITTNHSSHFSCNKVNFLYFYFPFFI